MTLQRLENAPRLGMGCWAIGGPFWNGDIAVGYSGTNDSDSRAAITAAWDSGVRIFDTSAVYGAGHSETLLGQVLGNRPEAILVSKFGHSFDAESKQMTGPRYDAEYIRASLGHSLKRLKRDRIDVLLLHLNGLEVEQAAGVFDTLQDLREQGQIGSFGWSTDFPASLNAMAGRAGFSTVQHAMNLFFDAPGLCAMARSHDVMQLIRSPLAMGLLTGKFGDDRQVGPDDIRRNDADWQGYFHNGKARADYARQLESVRELITVNGRTPAQGALCWLLAKSAKIVPLPGARTAAQAVENAAALDHGSLSAATMAEIETVLKRPPEGPFRAR